MMAKSLLTLALLALALPSPAARAQGGLSGGQFDGLSGGLLTWERVGDRPIDAKALAFDGDGTLYACDHVEVLRLDPSGGFPGVWELRSDRAGGDAMLALGPDTVFVTSDTYTERSTDGGRTWATVYDSGTGAAFGLHEAPSGTPLAGTLFVGGFPFGASGDRGATWEERGAIPGLGASPTAYAALASGSSLWGFNRFVTYAVAVTRAPAGGERVVVVGVDATAPHVRAWYSDDGGETWAPEAGYPLPEPPDGVGAGRTAGVWAVVGRVPDVTESAMAFTSAVGPDGRLYVALNQIGSAFEWVWRTQQRVVAAEPGPPASEPLGLEVAPNPFRDAAAITLTLAAPAEVEVALYDVLGRRAAVLASGALPAGRHEIALDGAALPAGVYVVRVQARAVSGAERGSAVVTRRVTLLR